MRSHGRPLGGRHVGLAGQQMMPQEDALPSVRASEWPGAEWLAGGRRTTTRTSTGWRRN
jgi:hypothetical protein